MKEKILLYLPSVIFNIAEILVIILTGVLLRLDCEHIILIIITFFIVRMASNSSMHYKKWYLCLIYSTLAFLSLFIVAKVNLLLSIAITIFYALILTGKGNINDMFMWSGNESKYEPLRNFISLSPNNPILLEHEEYWRKNYSMRYKILQSFFRERKTYSMIMDEENLSDNSVIKTECKTIYSILEKPLNLPPIKN